MTNITPILAVIKSSLENINQLSLDVLNKSKKSKVIPPVHKKMLGEISLASTAALNYLYTLESELKKTVQ